ncbi:MAG TPA: ATP-binding cassette domain-containing protein [Mycobacteriales bacterium]|nr:ATP-binding cassette domain-containing protein [Mycobacteriales bacterium]
MSILEARGLRYERDGRVILDGVDLVAGPGESVAVVGPSGSGKTSLLALLSGLAAPAAGTVLVDGRPLTTVDHSQLAVVLQGYGLISLLTAAENVEAAVRAAGQPLDDVAATAAEALASVGLAGHEEQLIEELSGGQQQRVAVARALALRPAILIADEPTAEQDQASRELVLERLFAVPHRDGSLVLATHDPEVADRCDHVVSLHPHE